MSNQFSRGSEWRKWDLHVHTPKSIIQHYGGDTPDAWEKYILDLESLPEEYKVLGINDYIFIDGYKEVLKYKSQGRLKNIDLILPVVELRVNLFASVGDEAWKKVNLHIIFSDEIKPEAIESQFINAIQHTIKLSPDIDGITFDGIATKEYLEEIGEKIKQTSTVPINEPAIKVGFANIFFDYNKVIDLTKGYFNGKCLTAVGKSEWETMRWTGSAAQKKDVINRAAFSFTSLEKPSDYGKHIEALNKQGVRSYLLDCSDAHSFSSEQVKDRIGNSFTWIKADPTFSGLLQVANDKDRIFVGEVPPLLNRLKFNKGKFIESLKVHKDIQSTLNELWFDGLELIFNPSMVAIIGNKGNGKSAIADILGLLGNTPNYLNFSFLSNSKFRKKKPIDRSTLYTANLTWMNGQTDSKRLSQNPDTTAVEKVKYIPQGFLEKLCNGEVEEFEVELRSVIFSHLPVEERYGKQNLDEILEYMTSNLQEQVSSIKIQLSALNRIIAELESKSSDHYKEAIDSLLADLQQKLNYHDSQKPIPVDAPDSASLQEEFRKVNESLVLKRTALSTVETEIEQHKISRLDELVRITELENVKKSIDSFRQQYDILKSQIEEPLGRNNLVLEQIVNVQFDFDSLDNSIRISVDKANSLASQLSNAEGNGLQNIKQNIEKEIQLLQESLDEPSRKYQKYLDDLRQWETIRKQIVGSTDQEGTIQYLQEQLRYWKEDLQSEIVKGKQKRNELAIQIFNKKHEMLLLFQKMFLPITHFIQEAGELLSTYDIQLDVNLRLTGFEEKFFDHISLGAKGSFLGNPAGPEFLRNLLDHAALKEEAGLLAFLDDVVNSLHFDKRPGQESEKREIANQLKKGYTVEELYDFLYGLDYLIPEYNLKLGDKVVSELSPGERGALLLIFYLMLDKSDIPLVIDQPEENLDNQSVFKVIVQFIKATKERRQIIVVTHNPNLAVACNAEQVIHMNIDKQDNYRVTFKSGSLENETINNAVIDILEGTYPALDSRTKTYGIVPRNKA